MRHRSSGPAALVLFVSTAAACAGQQPPPPLLTVTSPARSLMQESGSVTVRGTVQPNADGDPVSRVTVNGIAATLGADGSFSAAIDVPDGASIIETVASTEYGGTATDARSVQSGHRIPVGSNIDRAVTASLSADAFVKMSAAAGPLIKSMNLPAMLAPLQPMANLGDSIANVKLSIDQLSFDDVKVALTPTDGGLEFSAEIDGLNASATAVYAGALVPDGTTTVTVATDKVVISGMLVVTPKGTAGFTTTIASPLVQTGKLQLNANGLTGQILTLVNNNLGSTVQNLATTAAAHGLEPLMNDALGALGGPRQVEVLGAMVQVEATPAAVAFSTAGAVVTMNLKTMIAGSESSPGFIVTPNGMPTLDPNAGIQVALADDLVNEILAETHALGLMEVHVEKDFGLFDALDIRMASPPMVSADTADGTLHLVMGDMTAAFTDHGQPFISAAINAEVDLKILRGTSANQVALQFGDIHLWVNQLEDPSRPASGAEVELTGPAAAGIDLQLKSLTPFLVTVPVPAVAGIQLDDLEMHTDSGYLLISGAIH